MVICVAEAAEDPRAYERLYEAIQHHQDPGKEIFNIVVQSITIRSVKEPKLRNRLMPHSRTGSERRSSRSDPEVQRSLAYLTVLHGVVWSFPYTMNVLFTDPIICTLLRDFILSTAIPLIVRETMLTMVSCWCVLYVKSLRARINLEGIVDDIKVKLNWRPSERLLPDPPVKWKQEGWHYPKLSPSPQQIQTHGSMPALTDSRGGPMMSPGSISYNASSINDAAFLSQQRELMNSFNSRSSARPRASLEDNAITPEFTKHMLNSAQELSSLSDMLTETLVSLNIEEDPSTNSVVTDMLSDIKKRKEALLNFVSMLGQDQMETLATLTQTRDNVDRCLWLYEKTINSHNEWKAIQESLETSNVHEQRRMASVDDVHANYTQRTIDRYPASASAIASTSKVHGDLSRNTHVTKPYASPESQPAPGMSSKARGKMPDLSLPDSEL
ncbi:hypothetical protein EV183_000082 [Coemansia sp. RSA 2336]|nr:hypothetical protein EV183_000082 [Coemansia sp. RSA 2336]